MYERINSLLRKMPLWGTLFHYLKLPNQINKSPVEKPRYTAIEYRTTRFSKANVLKEYWNPSAKIIILTGTHGERSSTGFGRPWDLVFENTTTFIQSLWPYYNNRKTVDLELQKAWKVMFGLQNQTRGAMNVLSRTLRFLSPRPSK